MDEVVIQTNNLTKSFGRQIAVRDLTLRVGIGDVYGFLGPNGAGKSTTIRMLLGLIRPNRGEALLFGCNISKNRREILKDVGALVEAPSFYKYLTARDNLRILSRLSGGCTEKRIDEVLDVVGLLDRANDKVCTFSHGMCQRLGVAQALLPQPKVVILDEPTSGLDPQGIKDMRELIKWLATEQKVTVFLSSHLLHEVEQVCNRVGIIHRGKLLAEGNVDQLLQRKTEVVEFTVDDASRAAEVVRHFEWAEITAVNTSRMEVQVAHQRIPDLNRSLVNEGIGVFSITPKTVNLEELFFDIIRNTSGDVNNNPS